MYPKKEKYPKLQEINDKPEEFMTQVREFVARPLGFFIIAGTNGSGKTFVAEAIFGKFFHPWNDNMFWNIVDLKMKMNDLYNRSETLDYLFEEMVKAPLLVLDDLGVSKPSEAMIDFIYNLVDKRFQNRSRCGTIITTNLNASKMREVFGDAIVSRIASGRKIRHDGPDRRPEEF